MLKFAWNHLRTLFLDRLFHSYMNLVFWKFDQKVQFLVKKKSTFCGIFWCNPKSKMDSLRHFHSKNVHFNIHHNKTSKVTVRNILHNFKVYLSVSVSFGSVSGLPAATVALELIGFPSPCYRNVLDRIVLGSKIISTWISLLNFYQFIHLNSRFPKIIPAIIFQMRRVVLTLSDF